MPRWRLEGGGLGPLTYIVADQTSLGRYLDPLPLDSQSRLTIRPMATITAAELEISKKVWRVVYNVVKVDSFAEIREIDAEFVENLYTETLEENEYEDVPNPEDVSWEVYDGVADDLRDVLHTGLCDALSGDGWPAPSHDEDCYLSAEWED